MHKPQTSIFAALGLTFAVGVATMLLVYLFVPAKEIYAKYSLPALDGLPPVGQFIIGFNVTRLILMAGAAVCGFYTGWRRAAPASLAYGAGAIAIPALISMSDSEAYHGQFGFLAVVFLILLHAFFILWPVLFGFAGGASLSALQERFRSSSTQLCPPGPSASPLAERNSSPPPS
jgi:hypothetical protein